MFRSTLSHRDAPEIKIHFLTYKNQLIHATRSARSRIWISTYVINANLNYQSDPITLLFSILRRRMENGVDVKIICDDPKHNRPNYHCNKFIFRWLEQWQIPYCTPGPKITAHAKTVLIDTSHLFIGSHNLAKSSLNNPIECTVEIKAPSIIAEYATAYETIWNDVGMIRHMPPFRDEPGAPRPWMEHGYGKSD